MQWSTNKAVIQASLNSLDTLALSLGEGYWDGCWSSTENFNASTYLLFTSNGFIDGNSKIYEGLVRAFCEL